MFWAPPLVHYGHQVPETLLLPTVTLREDPHMISLKPWPDPTLLFSGSGFPLPKDRISPVSVTCYCLQQPLLPQGFPGLASSDALSSRQGECDPSPKMMNYEKPEDAALNQPSGNFTERSGRGQGMYGNVMHLLSIFAFLPTACPVTKSS